MAYRRKSLSEESFSLPSPSSSPYKPAEPKISTNYRPKYSLSPPTSPQASSSKHESRYRLPSFKSMFGNIGMADPHLTDDEDVPPSSDFGYNYSEYELSDPEPFDDRRSVFDDDRPSMSPFLDDRKHRLSISSEHEEDAIMALLDLRRRPRLLSESSAPSLVAAISPDTELETPLFPATPDDDSDIKFEEELDPFSVESAERFVRPTSIAALINPMPAKTELDIPTVSIPSETKSPEEPTPDPLAHSAPVLHMTPAPAQMETDQPSPHEITAPLPEMEIDESESEPVAEEVLPPIESHSEPIVSPDTATTPLPQMEVEDIKESEPQPTTVEVLPPVESQSEPATTLPEMEVDDIKESEPQPTTEDVIPPVESQSEPVASPEPSVLAPSLISCPPSPQLPSLPCEPEELKPMLSLEPSNSPSPGNRSLSPLSSPSSPKSSPLPRLSPSPQPEDPPSPLSDISSREVNNRTPEPRRVSTKRRSLTVNDDVRLPLPKKTKRELEPEAVAGPSAEEQQEKRRVSVPVKKVPKGRKRKGSHREISPPLPPPVPLSDTERNELVGMVVETLAMTRASSMDGESVWRGVIDTRPHLQTKRSKAEWKQVLYDVLGDGAGVGYFGTVASSGKDEKNNSLPPRYFYIPEKDPDTDRTKLLKEMMPRAAGRRSESLKYKQYYWKPLEKWSRWDAEEEM